MTSLHTMENKLFLSLIIMKVLLNLCFWTCTSPTYNITVTQIAIGKSVAELEFYAIWDSGTSFTYLNDPAYTQISKSVSCVFHNIILCFWFITSMIYHTCVIVFLQFNSAIKDKRVTNYSDLPFEYCYTIR